MDNIFFIPPNISELTKRVVIQYYPFEGNFHFRFKTFDSNFGFVWIDLIDDDDLVPLYKGSVHMKVLQLPGPVRRKEVEFSDF